MIKLMPGALKIMSVLFAICDKNIALLAADSRMVTCGDENGDIIDDHQHKIFKINDRLLFGGVGSIKGYESLVDAFKDVDYANLTLECADILLQEYMNGIMEKVHSTGHRTYILVGRNLNEDICVYTYDYNTTTKTSNIERINLAQCDMCEIYIGLPPSLAGQSDVYAKKLRTIMNREDTISGLKDGISGLIRDISNVDVTVGGEPEFVRI